MQNASRGRNYAQQDPFEMYKTNLAECPSTTPTKSPSDVPTPVEPHIISQSAAQNAAVPGSTLPSSNPCKVVASSAVHELATSCRNLCRKTNDGTYDTALLLNSACRLCTIAATCARAIPHFIKYYRESVEK